MEKQPIEELHYRTTDRIEVFLDWHRDANILMLTVKDSKVDPPFEATFQVPNDKGIEAFNHPYAWMPEELTQAV